MPEFDLPALCQSLQDLGRLLCTWRDEPEARQVHDARQFKTEVDRRAHTHLVDTLFRLSPDTPVISEEDDPAALAQATHQRPARYWMIDPLDGTASWYGGFAGFVTQVALIVDDQPVLGALHAPVPNKTWVARRGHGAWLNGARLLPRRVQRSPVFVDNTSTPHGITQRLMDALQTTGYVESGSLGLKAALVADGSADVFIKDVVVRDWDLAPVAVLLAETGGVLLDLAGRPYRFCGALEKSGGFIAAAAASLGETVLRANGSWRGTPDPPDIRLANPCLTPMP